MGAMARVYLGRAPAGGARPPGWTCAGDLLDRARRRHPAQGAADRDVRRADRRRRLAVVDRSVRWLAALRPLPGMRLALLAGAAVVRRHHRAAPAASFFAESVGHDLLAQGDQRAGGARRAAGLLFRAVLGDVLAGRDAGRDGGAERLGGAAREGRADSCWPGSCRPGSCSNWCSTKLPHYVLPLYPAIAILIAGVVDPHVLARERWLARGTGWWFVLPAILGDRRRSSLLVMFGRQLGLLAWPFAAAAMIFGLWAWWLFEADGAEHSLLRAMVASILLAYRDLRLHHPVADTAFPSAALAAHPARGRLQARRWSRRPATRSRAWCSSPAPRPAGRRLRCRRFPAPRRLPVCAGRVAARARLPAARRSDRAALCAAAALRGLQLLHRPRDFDRGLSIRGRAVSAAGGARRSRRRRRRGCGSCAERARRRSRRCCATAPAGRMAAAAGRMLLLGAALAVVAIVCDHVPARRLVALAAGAGGLPTVAGRRRSTASPISACRAGFCGRSGSSLIALAAARLAGAAAVLARHVLAAWAVRLGFVFTAIARAGPVRDHRQAADRARAAVRRRRRHLGLRAVQLAARLSRACRPATPPRPLSALVAIGAIFPQARALMWIYAVLIALSRVVVTAHYPSDVIAGAIVGAVGRAPGAQLVRRPPARICGRSRRFGAGDARPELSAHHQSSCPPPALCLEARGRSPSQPSHERRHQHPGRLGHRSGAERGRQHRAAGGRDRGRAGRPARSR